MRKNFRFYAACWAIFFALFNVVCFVLPDEIAGVSKFDGSFWVGYIFITAAFLGQLACAFIAFRAENQKKLFYRIPLITISYTALIMTLVIGAVCMALPGIPKWVTLLLCVLVFAFSAVSVLKAGASAAIVEGIDEKVAVKSSFIRTLTGEAENLVNCAKSDEIRKECRRVYEAVRYSDPLSEGALAELEAKISAGMDKLAGAVKSEDEEKTKAFAEEVTVLVKERNIRCRSLK